MKAYHLLFAAIAFLAILVIPAASQPKRAGTIALVNGRVIVTSRGVTFPAEPGSPVYEGDRIRSFNPGKAKIVFTDDTIINIGRDTEFEIKTASFSLFRRDSSFDVFRGRFKVAVGKLFTGTSQFELRTPTVVTGVRGTVFWGDTELDAMCALQGEIEVTPVSNPSARQYLKDGQCAAGYKGGNPAAISPTAEAVRGYIDEVTPE
ncbi:MAG: FecR domain-containing protein [Deltaproteobacteria bacterium]|nr:FecR domain-containing protein [Deltaproteobacteria bacterium]